MNIQTKTKIVYVDMYNVLADIGSGLNRVPEEVINSYDCGDKIPGIFLLMDPLPENLFLLEIISYLCNKVIILCFKANKKYYMS